MLKHGLVEVSAAFTVKYCPFTILAQRNTPAIVDIRADGDVVVVDSDGFKMIRKTVN